MSGIVSFMFLDGLLLYIAIVVFLCFELIAMQHNRPGICTGLFVLGLIVLEYCSPIHPLSYFYHHPVLALLIIATYFALGSIWIIAKWFSYVYKVRDKFNTVKQSVIQNIRAQGNSSDFNSNGSLTEFGKIKLYGLAAKKINERQLPLQVSQHKAELYTWWLCWPLSLFWTVLNDPIIRLWNFVYNLCGNFMQRISDNSIDPN